MGIADEGAYGILDQVVLSTTVIPVSPGVMIGTIVSLLLWLGIGWLVMRWLGVLPRARRGH
jgi:hypothetical protein